jgi:hypothetical protein
MNQETGTQEKSAENLESRLQRMRSNGQAFKPGILGGNTLLPGFVVSRLIASVCLLFSCFPD